MLPVEIICLSCKHCTIEETGFISCPLYPDGITKDIIMFGEKYCDNPEMSYQKLLPSEQENRQRLLFAQVKNKQV